MKNTASLIGVVSGSVALCFALLTLAVQLIGASLDKQWHAGLGLAGVLFAVPTILLAAQVKTASRAATAPLAKRLIACGAAGAAVTILLGGRVMSVGLALAAVGGVLALRAAWAATAAMQAAAELSVDEPTT